MFKKLLESFTTVTGSRRGDALASSQMLVKQAVIAHWITVDQSYRAAGEAMLAVRDQLAGKQHIPDSAIAGLECVVDVFAADLKRLYDEHGITDRINAAYSIPHGAPSANYTHGAKYGTVLSSRELDSFRAALVANDHQRNFWSDAEVLSEQSRFGFGGLPSIDWLVERYGEEAVRAATKDLVESRTK